MPAGTPRTSNEAGHAWCQDAPRMSARTEMNRRIVKATNFRSSCKTTPSPCTIVPSFKNRVNTATTGKPGSFMPLQPMVRAPCRPNKMASDAQPRSPLLTHAAALFGIHSNGSMPTVTDWAGSSPNASHSLGLVIEYRARISMLVYAGLSQPLQVVSRFAASRGQAGLPRMWIRRVPLADPYL